MFEPAHLLAYVPLLPLVGAILCAMFGSVKELRKWAHVPAVLAAVSACVCAVVILMTVRSAGGEAVRVNLGEWFSIENRVMLPGGNMTQKSSSLVVNVAFSADALTAVMLLGITFIGSFIVIFSIGYMHGSPGYPRYFAVVSLFLASMALLVVGDNFLVLFAGWEGVGLCSYLLVGYWYHKNSAADAARKAFLVTRLGDVGLILGIFLIWWMTGRTTIEFQSVFQLAGRMHADFPLMFPTACLLLLCGAIGKSAQFPLYVWLPDAMEGPTPVSALIHAATMVTAGVYLLARCAPLYVLVPQVQLSIALIGGITALLAALIAVTQHDLKRVLAYSTVSQLGFMFMALGCSGPALPTLAVTAAVFHLFTHAFFKAVLFLSAGSVMHAMHDVIDMRQFSGLRRKLPVTHVAFLCGAAALAGVPLLSGFWSKDMILESIIDAKRGSKWAMAYWIVFGMAVVTAFLTAFYTFRAYFRTFWGETTMPEGAHPHETWTMNFPLIILGAGALLVGIVAEPFTHWFSNLLTTAEPIRTAAKGKMPHHHLNWPLIYASAAMALGGIGTAYYMYVVNPASARSAARSLAGPYFWSSNRFYVDEIYNALFVQPLTVLAAICRAVEAVLFDLVRLIAAVPRLIGELIKPLQNGLVQFYALSMAMGAAAFVGYLVLFAK